MVKFPNSTSDLIRAFNSKGFFSSKSCKVEVLWSPTSLAPSILFSISNFIGIFNFWAISLASVIILNIIFLVSWVSHIFFKVALVIIDKGLKELLPINFNQISLLIFLLIGAFIPADMKSFDNTSTLEVFKLSGSPRINLLPSTCSITPGLFINAAG